MGVSLVCERADKLCVCERAPDLRAYEKFDRLCAGESHPSTRPRHPIYCTHDKSGVWPRGKPRGPEFIANCVIFHLVTYTNKIASSARATVCLRL